MDYLVNDVPASSDYTSKYGYGRCVFSLQSSTGFLTF